MPKFKNLIVVVAIVLGVSVFFQNCRQRTKIVTIDTIQTDSIDLTPIDESDFIALRDTLDDMFSELEVDLLKQYKRNYTHMQHVNDFVVFYRNMITLKGVVTKKLQKYSAQQKKEGKTKLDSMAWFKKLAYGLDITIVGNNPTYDVISDHNILQDFAFKTDGKADDEFMELMILCYDDYSYLPKWITLTSDTTACSQLGTGKHTEILMQIDVAMSISHVFEKEISKVKRSILDDILYGKQYCTSQALVVAELEKILKKVELSEADNEHVKSRIQQLKEPEKYSVVFNCLPANKKKPA